MARKPYDPSRFKVEEIIENISESDTSNWGKFIIRASFDDGPANINIRSMKLCDEPIIGKGISLTNEEVDTVVDTLVGMGFGSISKLKDSISDRQKQFGGFDMNSFMGTDDDDDDMLTIDGDQDV